jgi:hypothetical protein
VFKYASGIFGEDFVELEDILDKVGEFIMQSWINIFVTDITACY